MLKKTKMDLGSNNSDLFDKLVKYCMASGAINLDLYAEYDVKRGLRDSNGKGVLTGLTEISDVLSYKLVDGRKIPCDGELYYQGYNIEDLVKGFENKDYGFEETTYLLLFGELPTEEQLATFKNLLASMQELSARFIRDVLMKAPCNNIMNALQKGILTLYSYDSNPDDISVENVLRQSLELIAKMSLIAVYSYHSYRHFEMGETLVIRNPDPNRSIAENLLRMLRKDGKYTPLEAKVLDISLVLHAEHGGGNNSSFTTHVVSSSGTDTYSAIAASVGSLKGPRHGGANMKVQQMFADIKAHIDDWTDEDKIREYLVKILNKEAFDGAGLIYGMGHAVYTLSDPREKILKEYAKKLSKEKGKEDEFRLYDTVERIAAEEVMKARQLFKPVCANVDFYSGYVYSMLEIPEELYTPIFAISRISGWSAHRLEELVNKGKIIRPAYKYVGVHKAYVPMKDRHEPEEEAATAKNAETDK
ncbi:MAG: citrate/2-methylcitrate synthase [Lachnospiraceae bacterium]|mgnify:FL=1|nr:citrate/2-methylcitrate synthase [Lachnoclostridium sp.]MDD7521287.1 citrate/2-methylcitrate synthase [Lachnoclostridium sp.]MDY2600135.1 citrate/2-methylcitrate synthase [Lachnospiraceae bacterium]